MIVVDDDDLVRMLTAEALDEIGFHAMQFGTADEALMHIMRFPTNVKLVITDWNMPGQLDGSELAQMLHERYPAMPIVLTTGRALEMHAHPGITLLPKPWTLDQLRTLVVMLVAMSAG